MVKVTSIDHHRVIVTGSEGLIGRHVCAALEKRSCFSDIDDVIRLDVTLGHDLTDERCVKELFKQHVLKRDGTFNSLINLFAYNDHVKPGESRGTLFDLPLESFSMSLNVNLTALFSVCREFARNGGDNIINFGASTGIVSARTDMYGGAHKHVGYSVSKAGVIHLTKILAVHLAPDVRVNCISPGGVRVDQSDSFVQAYSGHTPMRRMASLDDLMPSLQMLLDPSNEYMVGANIVVDGGYTLW